ncbi:MAG: hypothetical protein ACLTBV_06695 [Enterocloster bolteae]
MLELCRHYGTSIIINSDAHCEADAGNHGFAHALLEEVDFPQELIVNTSLDRLCGFLPKAAAILPSRKMNVAGTCTGQEPYRRKPYRRETLRGK